jgi:hypothetical protein
VEKLRVASLVGSEAARKKNRKMVKAEGKGKGSGEVGKESEETRDEKGGVGLSGLFKTAGAYVPPHLRRPVEVSRGKDLEDETATGTSGSRVVVLKKSAFEEKSVAYRSKHSSVLLPFPFSFLDRS